MHNTRDFRPLDLFQGSTARLISCMVLAIDIMDGHDLSNQAGCGSYAALVLNIRTLE